MALESDFPFRWHLIKRGFEGINPSFVSRSALGLRSFNPYQYQYIMEPTRLNDRFLFLSFLIIHNTCFVLFVL